MHDDSRPGMYDDPLSRRWRVWRQAAAVLLQTAEVIVNQHIPAWTTLVADSALFGIPLAVACGRAWRESRAGSAGWSGFLRGCSRRVSRSADPRAGRKLLET
jgi:hypothetical protein